MAFAKACSIAVTLGAGVASASSAGSSPLYDVEAHVRELYPFDGEVSLEHLATLAATCVQLRTSGASARALR